MPRDGEYGMSCLPSMGRVPEGYGLHEPLPHSSPKRTMAKVLRLTKMAQSPKVKVRAAAAGNPMTPTYTLWVLSSDPSLLVRSWVARNPACPIAVLQSMAEADDDLGAYARWKIAPVVH